MLSSTCIDLDGIYHPGLFNHRLVMGLNGTMAEAELHVLRLRLNGAVRNKAKRGVKSRCERYVDEIGRVRNRIRLLPMEQTTRTGTNSANSRKLAERVVLLSTN
jgi:DNA invertase Pin-like site-specific DNA recombinase